MPSSLSLIRLLRERAPGRFSCDSETGSGKGLPSFARCMLFSASAGDHDFGGFKQYSQVEHDRQMLDIEEIVFELGLRFLDASPILILNLSPTRDAGTNRVP